MIFNLLDGGHHRGVIASKPCARSNRDHEVRPMVEQSRNPWGTRLSGEHARLLAQSAIAPVARNRDPHLSPPACPAGVASHRNDWACANAKSAGAAKV